MWFRSVLFSALAILSVAPAQAQRSSDRYLDCLLLIEQNIEQGRRAAQIWADEGGGINAQHCLALADITAGFGKLGAARLEAIAARPDAGDEEARGLLYAQAADAWLDAGVDDNADAAIRAALAHAPQAHELFLIKARVAFAREEWNEVIKAVDAAEKAGITSADSYVQRGRARLILGDTENAAHDVVRALQINIANIDALTLRGDVQRAGVEIDVSITPTTE